jgi:hypothetical protein
VFARAFPISAQRWRSIWACPTGQWKELPVTTRIKKAELHCHIEGAASPALVKEQAQKYGVDVSNFISGDALCLVRFHRISCSL